MSDLPRLDAGAIIKAVVIAFVVEIVSGIVAYWLVVSGVLTDDVIENSIVFHGFFFCLGLLPNIICGYLAAAFAGRNELIHGIVAGIALFALVGLFALFLVDILPIFYDPIPLLSMIPLSAISAVIAKHTK